MPVLPCLGGDGRGAHGVGWPAVSPPWGLSMESMEIVVKNAGENMRQNERQERPRPSPRGGALKSNVGTPVPS